MRDLGQHPVPTQSSSGAVVQSYHVVYAMKAEKSWSSFVFRPRESNSNMLVIGALEQGGVRRKMP